MKREKVETLRKAKLSACAIVTALCALIGFFLWPGFHDNRWANAIGYGLMGGFITYEALGTTLEEKDWVCAPSYLCRYCPMCGEELMDAAGTKVHRGSGLTIAECAPRAVSRLKAEVDAALEKLRRGGQH